MNIKRIASWVLFLALLDSVWNKNLGFSFLFAIILLGPYFEELEKRLRKLEQPPNSGDRSVTRFSVNVYSAIARNKRFGELVGLKENTKEISDWSKSDREKWEGKNGIGKKYKDKLSNIFFVYLPREDAYFVSRHDSNYSNIVARKLGKTCLYFDWIIEDRFSLEIWERIPHFWERMAKLVPNEELVFLTVCLKYQTSRWTSNEDEFKIICELPITYLIDSEQMGKKKYKELYAKINDYIKEAGYKVWHESWPDSPMKDDFEEQPLQSGFNKYTKDGVEIMFTY